MLGSYGEPSVLLSCCLSAEVDCPSVYCYEEVANKEYLRHLDNAIMGSHFLTIFPSLIVLNDP